MEPIYEIKKICVNEYLNDIRTKQNAVDSRLERYLRLRSRLEYPGISYGEKVSSSAESTIQDNILRLETLLDEYYSDMVLYIEDIESCRRICEEEHCRLVYERIVNRKTNYALAKELHYSTKTISRWVKVGTCLIYDEMPKRYKTLPAAI